ncbi:hypothetical protein CURTO8I2_140052 [Curtobacterium sp. 8I-2]|nr:hypothetical protein CURTO8I2_140052 [Curtobacterium sp. 8I-2]
MCAVRSRAAHTRVRDSRGAHSAERSRVASMTGRSGVQVARDDPVRSSRGKRAGEGPPHRRRTNPPSAEGVRLGHQRPRGRLLEPHRRGTPRRDQGAARAVRQRRDPRRPPARGVRRRA